MELHVGLDVSLESTSVCVVDETGKKVLEASVASDPEAVCIALRPHVLTIVRIGIEASRSRSTARGAGTTLSSSSSTSTSAPTRRTCIT